MGYRSDVVFALYPSAKDGFPAVRDWVRQHWPKDWCEIDETEDMVLVSYRDVKWYADHIFVQEATRATRAFEEAFDTEEYRGARAHWEMARLGEDDADAEREGSAYNDYRLGIRREIVW